MTVIENKKPKTVLIGPYSIGDVLPIEFPYTEPEDIKLQVNNELFTYNIDYTVFGQVLTLEKNIPLRANVTIFRETPLDQQAEFPQNNKFNSAKLNAALDKLTMQQQEQSETLLRCITANISLENFNGELPTPAPKQVLMWNEDVTALENYDIIGENEAFQESIREELAETVENIEEELDDFKQETNQTISAFRTETNDKIETFEDTVNTQITEIRNVANDANAVASEALQVANSTIDTANIALGISNNAVETANSADTKADNAILIANSASENAYQAVNTANEATTTAGNAQNIANSANDTAIAASNTANAASTKVDEFGETIEIVIDAAEKIEELESSIEEAKEAASIATIAAENATQAAEDAIGALDTKQDVIDDLDTIRAGAQAGATALQDIPMASASTLGGIKGGNWLTVNQTTGKMECGELTKAQYNSALGYTFISKTTLNNVLVDKQDKLISGTNIKTINNESILGAGNFDVSSIEPLSQEEYDRRKEAGELDENKYYSTPTDISLQLLEVLYPVGSLYITTTSTCPLATLGIGTWQLEAVDRVLQGAGSRGAVGTTIEAGLPNISGGFDVLLNGGLRDGDYYSSLTSHNTYGAFYREKTVNTDWYFASDKISTNQNGHYAGRFSASRSNPIYGNSDTVQQDAYLVNIYRRIA